ncbi:MAG: R3H domain-containing nucleic acid-binding protein [Patescibacteria group bacterium]
MDKILEKLNNLLNLLGFQEVKVNLDEEHRKISIFIDDKLVEENVAGFLSALDQVVSLMLKKENLPNYIVDVNYYRKERERLILELARAAAHKAMITKQAVELPPMNAYERRLVHLEITTHPELKTESLGLGKERHIVIKHLE